VQRQQQPGTVARDAVGGPGAAVRNGGEPCERTVDELAGRAPAGVGDEADAAGVALERPFVEERRRCQGLRLSGSWANVRDVPPAGVSVS